MTIRTFALPDLGEGLTEAEIITWLVAAGDTVTVDQPIVEVETAKAAVEVPCPFAGTVTTLHAEEDTALPVGAPLISVEDGIGVDAGGSGGEGSADGSDTAESKADAGSGNVLVGYGTSGSSTTRRRRRRGQDGAAPVAPVQDGAAPVAPVQDGAAPVAPVQDGAAPATPAQAPRVVNPLVRRLAREHGVDLTALQGSGAAGLIMRADVMTAAGAADAAPGAAAATTRAAAATAGARQLDERTGLAVTGVEKVTGMRKATAAAVSRSRREIPEATVWVDVDVTPLQELRAELTARSGEKAPGLLAFASRFALAGLARYPQLARRFEEETDGTQRIVAFDGINLGVAVQTDRGLVVPSVRGADTMTTRQLQGELRRLTELARSDEATAQDLTGGTFTVNNYGVFGVDGSAAIIPQDQASMLGMGRIVERGWGVDGELRLRQIMQLSLVFDHRICDGGTAGGFLRFVADCFEHPAGVLADL